MKKRNDHFVVIPPSDSYLPWEIPNQVVELVLSYGVYGEMIQALVEFT
jgi:hypothetical protein